MPFLKQDLAHQEYNWDLPGETIFNGSPSRRAFNRYNGNQVLFLINFYGSLAEKFSIGEGQLMEEVISNQLPLEAKSEISVFNWLRTAL
jgi:hypothetical protein